MGILFNVLDSCTYGSPDLSYIERLRLERYDYNTIPEDDRRQFVYARGVALELIEWLNSTLTITCLEGRRQKTIEIEDLQVQLITRQGLTIMHYLEDWTDEENQKDGSSFLDMDTEALGKQLEWAMHTIPWISSSWHDTLEENSESFYLDSLYPSAGQPVQRDETLPYERWGKKLHLLLSFNSLTFFRQSEGLSNGVNQRRQIVF